MLSPLASAASVTISVPVSVATSVPASVAPSIVASVVVLFTSFSISDKLWCFLVVVMDFLVVKREWCLVDGLLDDRRVVNRIVVGEIVVSLSSDEVVCGVVVAGSILNGG